MCDWCSVCLACSPSKARGWVNSEGWLWSLCGAPSNFRGAPPNHFRLAGGNTYAYILPMIHVRPSIGIQISFFASDSCALHLRRLFRFFNERELGFRGLSLTADISNVILCRNLKWESSYYGLPENEMSPKTKFCEIWWCDRISGICKHGGRVNSKPISFILFADRNKFARGQILISRRKLRAAFKQRFVAVCMLLDFCIHSVYE